MLSHARARAQATVRVPLTGRRGAGRYALVDAADADRVLAHRWALHSNGRPPGRSGHLTVLSSEHRGRIRLARLVLELDRGDPRVADHINGDPLDNRRANLRVATLAENARNCRAVRGAVRFKGVRRLESGRYQARIRGRAGNPTHLGTFPTAEEAAAAYDAAALELHGAFAVTNAAAGLLPRGGGA